MIIDEHALHNTGLVGNRLLYPLLLLTVLLGMVTLLTRFHFHTNVSSKDNQRLLIAVLALPHCIHALLQKLIDPLVD